MKKEIEVTVLEEDFYGDSGGFIEYSIPYLIDLVPEEYKATSKMVIEGDFDGGVVLISVTYTRPETDVEYSIRLEAERK